MNRVAIAGLGYVGLTLSVALARRGVDVLGYDREPRIVEALAAGRPHLYEPGIEEGLGELLGDRFRVVGALPRDSVDAAVLCVSTPVDPATGQPVLEPLRAAAGAVAEAFDPDTLVIVRSTVPVGASRTVVLPQLLARWGRARLLCGQTTAGRGRGPARRSPAGRRAAAQCGPTAPWGCLTARRVLGQIWGAFNLSLGGVRRPPGHARERPTICSSGKVAVRCWQAGFSTSA